MGKVAKIVGGIANATVDTTINVAAAAAGATVGTYCINHDVMNDADMSNIVGVAGGVGTFCIVRGGMRAVKNGTVGTVKAVKTKLSRKAKKNSTTP